MSTARARCFWVRWRGLRRGFQRIDLGLRERGLLFAQSCGLFGLIIGGGVARTAGFGRRRFLEVFLRLRCR